MSRVMPRFFLFFFCMSVASKATAPITNACGKVMDIPYSFDTAGTAGASDIVWFQQGFVMSTLRDITMGITCPVHGVINLANSSYRLSLANTLTLGSNAEIKNSGTIDGNSVHSVYLTSDLSYVEGQLVLKNITMEGRGRVFTLMPNATLFVPDDSYLEFKRLTVVLKQGARIVMGGVKSRLILSQVNLIFEENYRFDKGSLEINGSTIFTGKHAHDIIYVSSGSLIIKTLSTLVIGACLTFSYQCAREDTLVFVDKSACLLLDTSSFIASNVPVRLTKGTLRIKDFGTIEAVGDKGRIMYTLDSVSPQRFYVQQKPNVVRGTPEKGILYAEWD